MFDRRAFLATGSAFAALAANGCAPGARVASGGSSAATGLAYGPLVPDPAGLFDLPAGFSYTVISQLGDAMSDGLTVPDRADGMGCFQLPGGLIALVRNHELRPEHDPGGALPAGYDAKNGEPLAGGTTTIWLDPRTLEVKRQFRSLTGTIRNCAGGITPWGSWLTCEEDTTRAGNGLTREHGYIFEVPAAASSPVDAVPLTAMGRFNHEAAAVDPATGIVYLTEDRDDSLLYRFVPNEPGRLLQGGRLEALALADVTDTRNWDGVTVRPGETLAARWLPMSDVSAPEDDLRKRGAAAGAALFARGEGIWMGDGELYFTCTSGGPERLGQIFRLTPRSSGDLLDLFFESTDPTALHYGDNLCVAPGGHLVVCEDQGGDTVDNHIRWIAPDGTSSPLARLRIQTEWAGACFSPDGQTLFVNAYSPARTIAIRGPFRG